MMFFFVDRFVQLSSYSIDADSAHNYLFHCWFHLLSSCSWEYEYRRPREHEVSVGSSGGGREQRVEVTKGVRSSFEAGITKLPLTDTSSLYGSLIDMSSLYKFEYKTIFVVLLIVQRMFCWHQWFRTSQISSAGTLLWQISEVACTRIRSFERSPVERVSESWNGWVSRTRNI